MTFVPRRLPNGGVCCESATALCPACEQHFGKWPRAFNPRQLADAALRVGVTNDSDTTDREAVPDPYRAATSQAPRKPVPTDDADYQPFGTPPDGYQLALAARREAQ